MARLYRLRRRPDDHVRRAAWLVSLLTLAQLDAQVPAQPVPPAVLRSLTDADILPDLRQRLCEILRTTQHLGARRMHIERLFDEVLGKLGLPRIFPDGRRIALLVTDDAPRSGHFDHASWSILFDEETLRGGAGESQLVRALLHELRHVEHYWRVICWLIDSEQTGGLNIIVAPKAIFYEAYRQARQGTRPRVEGARAEEAKAWWMQWLVSEHRRRKRAFDKAAERVQRVLKDQRKYREELSALAKKLGAARTRRTGREAPAEAAERQAAEARSEQLKALLTAAAMEEQRARVEFERALKEYPLIPLEVDIGRLLAGVKDCERI